MNITQKFLAKLKTEKQPAGFSASFLRHLPERQLFSLATDLRRLLPKVNPVFGVPVPKDYSQLCDWSAVYESHNPTTDISVAAAEIAAFADTINRFVTYETIFNRHLLNQRYSDASKILDEIEENLGVSLWLIEKRLSVLELEKGVDAQKTFAQAMRQNELLPESLRTLIYFYSLKAEKAVPPERYNQMLARIFAKDTSGDATSFSYMRFHLGFFDSNVTSISTVLAFEHGSSIIDRYLTFIRTAQLAAIDRRYLELQPAFVRSISLIGEKICDSRYENLALRFTRPGKLSKGYTKLAADDGAKLLQLLDEYTRGAYEAVANNVERVNGQEYQAVFDVYCRSIARGKKDEDPSAFTLIAKDYITLLQKGKDCLESSNQLLKYVYMFPTSTWAAELYAQICRETSASGERSLQNYIEWGELNGSPFSPRLHARLHNASRTNANTCSPVEASLTYQFLASGRDSSSSFEKYRGLIPDGRIAKYLAKAQINLGNPGVAEEILQSLIESQDPIDSQDAITALIALYLDCGNFNKAAKLAAVTLASRPEMYLVIPLGEILFSYDEARSSAATIKPDIYVVSCFGLYSQLYDNDRDEETTITCEEFLTSKGVERPSELKGKVEHYDHAVITYFLYIICRPDILDSHIAYTNSVSIENERVAILQWLIELDENRRSLYADEIAQITQRQMIRQGVRTIESSKIYVDIKGIKNGVLRDFTELYARFLSLPDYADTVSELVLQLQKGVEKSGIIAFVLPMNERQAALRQLYLLVRDRFVSSNEYGLDVYLSVGIRHGTLSGQLRSVLERARLVTQKDEHGKYASNEHWTTQLCDEDAESEADPENQINTDIHRITSALSGFSEKVDKLIATLRDSWIQIRTEDKNHDALFNYVITTDDVIELATLIGQDTSVSEALDIVLECLWQKTDDSLKEVHAKLNSSYKLSFGAAIDECTNAIMDVSNSAVSQRLRSSLAMARTAIQSEIDNISTWFTRNSDNNVPPYELTFAISVAAEMVARCYPQHRLQLQREGNGHRQLNGRTLKGMVDILFIILDNLLKHCGKPNGNVSANLEYAAGEDAINITLYSEHYKDVDIAIENGLLETRLNEVMSKKTTDRVRREGGSGFHKIAKIVRVDFLSDLDLWFGYRDANQFEFRLTVSNGRPFDENPRS